MMMPPEDIDTLADKAQANLHEGVQYSRRRFLGTWLALALLALLTGILGFVALSTESENDEQAREIARLANARGVATQQQADDIEAYLRGEQGLPGVPGADGEDGTPGLPGTGAPGEPGISVRSGNGDRLVHRGRLDRVWQDQWVRQGFRASLGRREQPGQRVILARRATSERRVRAVQPGRMAQMERLVLMAWMGQQEQRGRRDRLDRRRVSR